MLVTRQNTISGSQRGIDTACSAQGMPLGRRSAVPCAMWRRLRAAAVPRCMVWHLAGLAMLAMLDKRAACMAYRQWRDSSHAVPPPSGPGWGWANRVMSEVMHRAAAASCCCNSLAML